MTLGPAPSADLPPEPSARDRLLARVVDFVLEHGVSDLSLSELARRVGSNNRMLLYYFTSKQQLLAEACEVAVRRFPRNDAVMDRLRTGSGPLRERLLRMWWDIAHPDNRPFLRLFFQAFAVSLYEPGGSGDVAERMGGTWVPDLQAVLVAEGYGPEQAPHLATEVVATLRGLQFALLSGGDRAGLDRSYRLLVDGLPAPAAAPSSARRDRGNTGETATA